MAVMSSNSVPAVTPLITGVTHELSVTERPPDEGGKLTNSAVRGLEMLLGVLMLGLVGLISVEVILRYFVNLPLDSATEIASFLFVWLAMLGAAAAVPLGAHMAIHPLHKHVGPIVTVSVHAVTTIAALAFGAFLALSGYEFTTSLSDATLPVTGISSIWEAAAFPACGALMVIFTLLGAGRDIARHRACRRDRDNQVQPSPLIGKS